MADTNPVVAGKPRGGFLGWLADRTSIEMSFVYFFWLAVAMNVVLRVVVLIPAFVESRKGDSFMLTGPGWSVALALIFGPVAASVIFRGRERSRLRRAGEIAEVKPLISADGEPNMRRFGYLFWRSGCGALASIALYFCLTPFVLWFYVFAVRMADPGATLLALDSPYFWGAAGLVALPMVLMVLRWLAYRAETTAGFAELPKPKMRPMRLWDRVGYGYATLLLLAMASAFLYGALVKGPSPRGVVRALRSASWPSVDGVVVSSGVEQVVDASGRRVVVPAVRYHYEIPDRGDHLGRELRVAYGWSRARPGRRTLAAEMDSATATAARYPVGKSVRVSYDPHDPASAVLEPGMHDFDFTAPMMSIIVLVIGLGCLWLAWRAARNREVPVDEGDESV